MNGHKRTRHVAVSAAAIALFLCAMAVAQPPERREIGPPDPERVAQIAQMLPDAPEGFGRPISDREAWERIGNHEAFKQVVARAEAYLKEPLPDLPDSLFLDFSKTGNRTRWQRRNGERSRRFSPLVLAECIENKGRFIPALEDYLRALCSEKTWVMPAHDRSLNNFHGKSISIDLRSSAEAFSLAQMDYMLGDRLHPEVRNMVRREVMRRVLTPFRLTMEGKRGRDGWMAGTSNWNAVCHCGVAGAALALIDDKRDRALYVAGIEDYIMNFLSGFPPDGYCTEGTGYWNYGFGRFTILAERLRQATGGGVDLMAHPHAKKAATYGARIQIVNGVSPAFADCGVTAKPSARIMWYVSRRYRLGLERYDAYDPAGPGGWLPESIMYSSPSIASETPPASGADSGPGLRSYFDSVGILICRPPGDAANAMGVALKGGNNGEHHNHNDVGSYVLVVGNDPLLVDPGGEVYTARTFSSKRYVSDVLNSFGHPVPRIAGTLQRVGSEARAEVIQTDFTDEADTFKLDLTRAYDVPELKRLERTWVYSRQGRGGLTVTDEVEFMSPEAFETAIVTISPWKKQKDGSVLIYDASGAIRVSVDTGGAAWQWAASELTADVHTKRQPVRLGIVLKAPATRARVTLRAEPAQMPGESSDPNQILRNGSFELETIGWSLSDKGLSALSDEQAASGETSLKIADPDKKQGSSATSAMMPAAPGKYVVRGKYYPVSGTGLGVYMRYYDDNRQSLNKTTGQKGFISPVGSLPEKKDKGWHEFAYPFEAPAGTTQMQIWLHSYTGSIVTLYLDDLEVLPADAAK